jgi:cytochrome c5
MCKAAKPVMPTPIPVRRLVHDRAAWDVRWAKGLPTLVDHAIVGFQAMPAGGQCVACTPKDYEGLIRFMADHEGTP